MILNDGDILNITAPTSPNASAPFRITVNITDNGVYTINGTAEQTYENVCILINTPGNGVPRALTLNLNNVHFKGPGVNSVWGHTLHSVGDTVTLTVNMNHSSLTGYRAGYASGIYTSYDLILNLIGTNKVSNENNDGVPAIDIHKTTLGSTALTIQGNGTLDVSAGDSVVSGSGGEAILCMGDLIIDADVFAKAGNAFTNKNAKSAITGQGNTIIGDGVTLTAIGGNSDTWSPFPALFTNNMTIGAKAIVTATGGNGGPTKSGAHGIYVDDLRIGKDAIVKTFGGNGGTGGVGVVVLQSDLLLSGELTAIGGTGTTFGGPGFYFDTSTSGVRLENADAKVSLKNGTPNDNTPLILAHAVPYKIFSVTNAGSIMGKLTDGSITVTPTDSQNCIVALTTETPSTPAVSPPQARYDGDHPTDTKFLLSGAALTAANAGKLSIIVTMEDGTTKTLTDTDYSISGRNFTITKQFLSTLSNGAHTFTLYSEARIVGKTTLDVTNSNSNGTKDSGSSGCNAGAGSAGLFAMGAVLLGWNKAARRKKLSDIN